MVTYIYALVDPITLEARYVGKTNNMRRRYNAHLKRGAVYNTHYGSWMRSLICRGLSPHMQLLDVVEGDGIAEEAWFIAKLPNLTNHCRGGIGFTGHHSDETKARISRSLIGNTRSKGKKLGPQRPEWRKAISAAMIGVAKSEQAKENMRQAALRRYSRA